MDLTPIRVLLVEDDEDDFLLTRRLLSGNGRATFEMTWVRSYDAALEELRAPQDVCLVDYRLSTEFRHDPTGADPGLPTRWTHAV